MLQEAKEKEPKAARVVEPAKAPANLKADAASPMSKLRGVGFQQGAAMLKPKARVPQAALKPVDKARAALASRGLPPQLIPESTTGFTLDEKTGRFTLTLAGKLQVAIPGAGVKLIFGRQISGVLQDGAITSISGISGKKLFFSARVSTIEAAGKNLRVVHSAGTAELPIDKIPAL